MADEPMRTSLSRVDGEAGWIRIRGRDLAELAGRVPFEEAVGLLWGKSASEVEAALERARLAVGPWPEPIDDPMDRVRARLGRVATEDPAELVATASLAAAPGTPGRGGHVADHLRRATGSTDPRREALLSTYFVTLCENGMNPSTYAARVVASTGAGLGACAAAAAGALQGPLHGGAPGPVLDMLEAVGSPERAAAWVEAELAAGRRIFGLGHPVFRGRDPRAAILERAAEAAGAPRLALARAVERAASAAFERKRGRPLPANVELYAAVVLDAAGIPRRAFTAAFASARSAAWAAHVAEQRATGRLVNPEVAYVDSDPDRG